MYKNNSEEHYYLFDRLTNVAVLEGVQQHVAAFVASTILDLRIERAGIYRKAHFDKSKAGKKHLTSVRKTQGGLSTSELTDDQKALIARGKLLARGYSFLVFRVDGISLQYSHLSSLELPDVVLYPTMRDGYIKTYAAEMSVSEDEAAKQLDFDYEALKSTTLRRKEVLWRFSERLRKVTTTAELDAWQTSLIDEISGIGMV